VSIVVAFIFRCRSREDNEVASARTAINIWKYKRSAFNVRQLVEGGVTYLVVCEALSSASQAQPARIHVVLASFAEGHLPSMRRLDPRLCSNKFQSWICLRPIWLEMRRPCSYPDAILAGTKLA
jgi:hypothetical protein